MIILHIISSVDPSHGGPIEGVRQQANMAGPDGFEVHVASLDAPDCPFIADFPAKVIALGAARPAWHKWTPWGHYEYHAAMVPWLRENVHRYDAVIVNGLWNYATMAARRVLPGSGVPYAVFTHGMLDPWFRQTYPIKHFAKRLSWRLCEGPLLNRADAVFFTTTDEMVVSDQAFSPYRVRGKVTGFGTADIAGDQHEQITAFRAALPALGDRPYLLYLSRIHPKKGVDMLIKAFATIARDHPELDLVIAGPDQVGWCAELAQLARDHGIADRIHWPGMLTGAQKWGAFRATRAFVLPSHQENFGVVVAEALACAKPVLISNKVQIWHEVQAHEAGIVKPDTQAGTDALLQEFVAMSPAHIARIEHHARTLFETQFDIRAAIGRIKGAVAQIIADHARPG